MIKNLRKIILIIWILAIITLWFYLFFHRELLDPRFLFLFFQSFWAWAIIIYLIVSIIRWIFLLPSLPLVFVGVFFFPDSSHLVFSISMIGIIFSGIIIYQFSEFLWFDEIFANKIENIKIQNAIEKYWFFAVLLWSFAPVVPTDVICYVAGTVRMNFLKFVSAMTLGEGIIVGLIIYGGKEVMNVFGI